MSQHKNRPSRLGRGLSSLMGQPVQVIPMPAAPTPATTAAGPTPATPVRSARTAPETPPPAASAAPAAPDTSFVELPLDAIAPNPFQPRQDFDKSALDQLAASIKSTGILQPVVVRPRKTHAGQGDGQEFELVTGERRWRAAAIAGLAAVPAIVRPMDDRQMAESALVENLQRQDLNPLERAAAFRQLGEQFGLTHDQIANRVGVERSTISNILRLLDLHPDVQQMVRHALLSAGHARAVAAIPDWQQQLIVAQKAVRAAWSVRRIEAAVRAITTTVSDKSAPGRQRATHLADLEQQLSQQLATKVAIRSGRKKGSGTLAIEFYSLDQFDALLARLGVKVD